MNFATYPITTVSPSDIGVFDLNNIFRPRQWDDRPEAIKMQQIENDRVLLSFMNRLPLAEREWTNPIMSFTIDTRLDQFTTTAKAVAVADTYVSLVSPYVVRPGYTLHFPQYGMQVMVVDVDDDLSEGWVNGAGDACNVKIDKTKIGGPNVIVPVGAYAYPGAPLLGEMGEAKIGTTTTPGDPQYNLISFAAIYFNMSRMQLNSEMLGGWGTQPKEMQNIEFQLDQRVQTDLLFAKRATWFDTNEKQMYQGAGLVEQLKDNVLDVVNLGNGLTYANLVDYWDPMFESRLSSSSKDHICGSAQFRDILKTARDANRLMEGPVYSADLGTNQFSVSTESGRTVRVHEEKWAFRGGLADWGITLDAANLGFGQYRGFGKQWIFDIQAPSAITTKAHALMTSYSANVYDDSTMGVIRGGTVALISDRQPNPAI